MGKKQLERLHIVAARYGARSRFVHESEGNVVLLSEDQLRRVRGGEDRIGQLTGWDERRQTVAPCYSLRQLVHLMEWLRLNHPRVYELWNTGKGRDPEESIGGWPPEGEKRCPG